MKRAFTFLELLSVLAIIAVVYGMFIANVKFDYKKKSTPLSFKTLKAYLLENHTFEKSLTFACLQFESNCYIFKDGKINKELSVEFKIDESTKFYAYNKILKELSFGEVEFDNLQSQEIRFQYTINKSGQSDDVIIESKDEVILLSSIQKPVVLQRVSMVDDYFEQRVNEVKNAF